MIEIMSENLLSLLRTLPGRNLTYSAGETVFHAQDPVLSLHIVCSGHIHLMRHQADGSALILQRAEDGAVLAEASLHSSHYHCDAIAKADSQTWAVKRSELQRQLRQNAVLSEAWFQHLAREVQRARLHAEILSLKTVAARLDAWIGWHGAPPEKGLWATTAQQIGVSPEALYREMAKRR